MVVYADLFALANLAIDALLLAAAARLAGLPTPWPRVLLAAALGAAYATAWYLGALPAPLESRAGVLAVPAAMVALAVPARGWRARAGALAWFYLLAGAVYGLTELLAGQPAAGWALALAAAASAAGAALWRAGARARVLAGQRAHLALRLGPTRVEVPALVDSGHLLRDPLGGAWVVIAEGDVVARLAQAAGSDPARVRRIPYSTIDREAGILVGLHCDEAEVAWEGGTARVPGVVVARPPAGGRLDPGGRFRAIVPLGLVAEAVESRPQPRRVVDA